MSVEIKLGEIYKTNSFGPLKVVGFKSANIIYVEFIKTGFKTSATKGCIVRGSVKDKLKPTVEGVGFLGVGKYSWAENNSAYRKWRQMLNRCYSKSYQEKFPTYKGCAVQKEWKNFQNFAEWFYDNYPNDGGKYQLDKDIKIKGNRVYSDLSCSFVTAENNIKFSKENKKEYTLINKKTKQIDVLTNINEFARKHNCYLANIHAVIKGKRKTCNGWMLYEGVQV